MGKVLKKSTHGGKRPNSGPRVTSENRKRQISMGFKSILIDSPEKLYKLKMAIYQYVENVYEKKVK